jgi:hypothetical protein
MAKTLVKFSIVAATTATLLSSCGFAQEYMSGIQWEEPPVVTPGKTNADPPSDATVLFDGKDLSKWENGENWKVKDGVATVGKGDIKTKESFGDCQLHIEWSAPNPPHGHSQGRGNSGVFMQDRYEVQVLDSYHDKTYFDGQASAIYKQTPPMANAMRPPGEWNTYDIVWNAPKFKDDDSLESPAYVTVLHNGVLTLNHFAVKGATPFTEVPKYEKHGKLPIHLQDHGNPVRYRNIWVREIKEPVGKRVREPYFHDHQTNKDTPIEKKSTMLNSHTQSAELVIDSAVNLGIGTPHLPGQVPGDIHSTTLPQAIIGPSTIQLEGVRSGVLTIGGSETRLQKDDLRQEKKQ